MHETMSSTYDVEDLLSRLESPELARYRKGLASVNTFVAHKSGMRGVLGFRVPTRREAEPLVFNERDIVVTMTHPRYVLTEDVIRDLSAAVRTAVGECAAAEATVLHLHDDSPQAQTRLDEAAMSLGRACSNLSNVLLYRKIVTRSIPEARAAAFADIARVATDERLRAVQSHEHTRAAALLEAAHLALTTSRSVVSVGDAIDYIVADLPRIVSEENPRLRNARKKARERIKHVRDVLTRRRAGTSRKPEE